MRRRRMPLAHVPAPRAAARHLDLPVRVQADAPLDIPAFEKLLRRRFYGVSRRGLSFEDVFGERLIPRKRRLP